MNLSVVLHLKDYRTTQPQFTFLCDCSKCMILFVGLCYRYVIPSIFINGVTISVYMHSLEMSHNMVSFYLHSSPDPTFVIDNVTAVLEKVSVNSRNQVLYGLLGSDRVYSELSSHTNDKDFIPACSEAYVSHPRSSWEYLTSLLYAEDELTAVDEARPFLPPRGESLLYSGSYFILGVHMV